MPVKAVPEGFHTVTPLLVAKGGAKLIDFLKNAFGGEETVRMPLPSGEIMHAEVKIGNSIVMLNDTMGQPTTAASLFLYVNDADSVVSEPADMFWGDRVAQVSDQFGNQWWIATHKEDVSAQGMQKRAEEAMKQQHH